MDKTTAAKNLIAEIAQDAYRKARNEKEAVADYDNAIDAGIAAAQTALFDLINTVKTYEFFAQNVLEDLTDEYARK